MQVVALACRPRQTPLAAAGKAGVLCGREGVFSLDLLHTSERMTSLVLSVSCCSPRGTSIGSTAAGWLRIAW